MNDKTILLVIMDGWGCGSDCSQNAIAVANVPNYRSLLQEYPNTKIHADGKFVGLPEGQMGNSEVGHLNLGAGRIVYQELTRINGAIKDKSFFENEAPEKRPNRPEPASSDLPHHPANVPA